MQRTLVASQGCFVHRFRQRRVSVADAGQVFGGTTEFHRHHGFGNQFGSIRSDDMDTENAVGLGTSQHLDETVRIAHAQCAAIGQERDLAGLVGDTVLV